jgi:hypothetical protein
MLSLGALLLIGLLWMETGLFAGQSPGDAAASEKESAGQDAGAAGHEPPMPAKGPGQLVERIERTALQDRSFLSGQSREGARVQFLPYAGTIRSGSGPAFGITMNAADLTPLRFDLSVSARMSTRAYQRHRLKLGSLQERRTTFQINPLGSRFYSEFNEWGVKRRGMVVYGDANFRSFRREDYFGPGPGSDEGERVNYHFRGASFDLVAGLQFNRWLGLSVRGGFIDPGLARGRSPDLPDLREQFEALPGMERQPWFFRISSALLLDYRDEPGNPHRGGMVGLMFSRFDDRGGDDFAFNRYGLDVRQFFPLFSDRNVLALRGLSLLDDPIRNGAVPFYFQETLGGSSCLRGFRDSRFRDDKLLCLSSEFRRELTDSLELALFYDGGKVFSDWSDLNFRRLERGYGGGFRFKASRFVIFRLDVGRSREGTRAHFKLGRSF